MDQYTPQLKDSSSEHALKLSKTELVSSSDQNAGGTPSSLWQAAYDNPVKTGLTVAAAAVAGAALLYASKGRAAERLLGSKADVLIIEDTPAMGLALKDAVTSKGHNATWVTSIKSLNPLRGISPEGAEVSLNQRFKVALVDGDLGKGMLTGPEIVGTLRQHKIMSIGTSTMDTFNTAMKANGAEIAGNKAIIYTSLLGGQLDLKAALKAPAAVQEGLDAFGKVIRTPQFEALRKQADEKLMSFVLQKA